MATSLANEGSISDHAIRPKPDITLKEGQWFAMCYGGLNCRGEKCTYAHSLKEMKIWNSQLQNSEVFTITVDELKLKIPSMGASTEETKALDWKVLEKIGFPTIIEDEDTPDDMLAKPSCTYADIGIHMVLDKETKETTYGKWLVFRDLDNIDETWSKIVQAMKHDKLGGCTEAKCTTRMYNPHSHGPGPCTTGQISVYTGENNVSVVGYKLVELVKQDIKYKSEEDTHEEKFVHTGYGYLTIKTIYYNDGDPSSVLKSNLCYGASPHRDDVWHMNVVKCPEVDKEAFGYWRLVLECKELSYLWHYLKERVETEGEKFGVLQMICPSKVNTKSKEEKPIFQAFTSKTHMESTGLKLINLLERNIKYKELASGNTTEVLWKW